MWLALALGLLGAALIVRPGLHVGWVPGLVGVLGGLASGLAYMTVRMLGRSEKPITVVMAFPVIAGPLSLPFALPVWVWPTATGGPPSSGRRSRPRAGRCCSRSG